MRAYLGEALTTRGLVEPGLYSMTEVLAPTMIDYAPPELAAEMVPRLLPGDETWCQGFSEPGTGSNLASLSCRATRTGRVGGSRAEGVDQLGPVRAALRAPHAHRNTESAHRGITALFADMDSARHHGAADRDHARRRGVLRGLLRRRRRAARPNVWARWEAVGPWPWTSCPTNAARRCGTAPPTCSGGWSSWWTPPRPVRSTRRGR
jgi:hypothetical protein